MKILLLGKDGQVGHSLQRALLPLGLLSAHGRNTADLRNQDQLTDLIEREAPDVIVNAAAYTAVDKAESDREVAFLINAHAVGNLARQAIRQRALLVHYSTDYVFDGTKDSPYLPDDATSPQSVYGASKRAGEQAIFDAGATALVFRTSWGFSSHGGNFVKTMLRLAKEREAFDIVADQHGAPTSAELIADVTSHAILAHRAGRLDNGIHHLTASGHTTWHGLARRVVARAITNGTVLSASPDRIAPISTQQYSTPAKRPLNSRLDTTALQKTLALQFPDWSVYVDRVVDQLTLP